MAQVVVTWCRLSSFELERLTIRRKFLTLTSQIFNFSLISSDLWSWILDLLLYVLERGGRRSELVRCCQNCNKSKKISGYFASSNSGRGRQEKGNFHWWSLIGWHLESATKKSKIVQDPSLSLIYQGAEVLLGTRHLAVLAFCGLPTCTYYLAISKLTPSQ